MLAGLGMPFRQAHGKEVERVTPIGIPPASIRESNIPNVATYLGPQGLDLRLTNATPADAACFWIRYRVTVPAAGRYRVRVRTARSQRARSAFSCLLDGGAPSELVHVRRVGEAVAWRESPEPVVLTVGEHTLEFRFSPEQRVRVMNRVTEPFEAHAALFSEIELAWVGAERPQPAPPPAPGRFQLRDGDRVVFLGDSITDEDLYPAHVARLVNLAFPDRRVEFFNSGIALNRAVDVLARLDQDVLPLKPDWVVLCIGVNDAMQVAPTDYERQVDLILTRLCAAGLRVLCVTPTGFHEERFPSTGQFVHTRDRMRAVDHTAAHAAEVLLRLAAEHGCLAADALGALTRSDLPRERLMANQWHPNAEGGRLVALALLQAWGFVAADAARSGDARDVAYRRLLDHVSAVAYPRFECPAQKLSPLTGRLMAVSSFTRNAVYLFGRDGRDHGKLRAVVPVGHHPGGMVFNPARSELYVACEGPGRVDVIDLRTSACVASIALDDDDYPTSLALAPDGMTAWVGSYYGSCVTELDLVGRRSGRTIPVGAFVQSVMLTADGARLLAGTSQGIVAIDLAAGVVAERLPVDFVGAFVPLPGGDVGAVETVFWQMHVLSAGNLQPKSVAAPPFASRGLAHDPASGTWWAGDWQRDRLVTVGPDGRTKDVAEVDFPFGVCLIDWQP